MSQLPEALIDPGISLHPIHADRATAHLEIEQ